MERYKVGSPSAMGYLRIFSLLLILKLAGLAVPCAADPPSPPDSEPDTEAGAIAGGLVRETDFGDNPGRLNMWKYVPADMPPNAPLVVALHGCSQRAASYVDAGWNQLADLWKFYVIYPEQRAQNNPAYCFNWAGSYGNPLHLIRGRGENMSIKQMVDKMKTDYAIDGNRVFITGFSSGGAFAAVMLATWPEVFAGGAILSGIPYYCASNLPDAYRCMNGQVRRTPVEWGDRVRNAFPDYSGPYPKVSIWHGTADITVRPVNQTELMKQWTNVHGIEPEPDAPDKVDGYLHQTYRNRDGVTAVETYEITGMRHGVALNPGFEPANGCGRVRPYMIDMEICSTYYIAKAWGLDKHD